MMRNNINKQIISSSIVLFLLCSNCLCITNNGNSFSSKSILSYSFNIHLTSDIINSFDNESSRAKLLNKGYVVNYTLPWPSYFFSFIAEKNTFNSSYRPNIVFALRGVNVNNSKVLDFYGSYNISGSNDKNGQIRNEEKGKQFLIEHGMEFTSSCNLTINWVIVNIYINYNDT
jgi:hypothetical protein